MCGLTGLLERGAPARDLEPRLQAMAERLAHRGPDGNGIWAEEGVGFGHRRLAILDPGPAGAQPMHSACGRWTIAFNGEIYNHFDLRRDLEATGAAPDWIGHSDTETLLAAIASWGLDETLTRVSGMFALALWDRKARRLALARDRFGEKPLYWGWIGRGLAFGSELKALLECPGFERTLDRGALVQYLRFAYVPAPRSIYRGIYKLEPGTILEVSDTPPGSAPSSPIRPGESHDTLSIRRYWSLLDTIEAGARTPITDEVEALAALERTLSSAVERQMISDVPLGAFLSGGVDSSLIAALMQSHSNRPVRTFTVGFESTNFDESPHAEAVARHLGTDHTTVHVSEHDAREVIPDLPGLYDEPFGDSSQIPTHLVCQAARAKVTVALSGDAGDELFGGYNRHIHGPGLWRRIAWMPPAMRRAVGTSLGVIPRHQWDLLGGLLNRLQRDANGVASFGDKAHRIAARLQDADSFDELYRSVVSISPRPLAFLGPDIHESEPPSLLDDALPLHGASSPAARMMVQDMRSYLPDDILCKVDRAAMGIGLETRVPFLDPDVVKLAASLPTSMKIRNGTGKWPLREVLYRHVPKAIIDRPKMGFALPIGPWLRGPLRDWAEELLAPDRLAAEGLLDPEPIRQLWNEHLSGHRDQSQGLWNILMLQAWRETYG